MMSSIICNSASIPVTNMSEKILKVGRASFILQVSSRKINFPGSYENSKIVSKNN